MINHDCKTSFELIRDGLFTNWNLILGCMTSNFLYPSFSTLLASSLRRTDTIVFSKLNTPSLK